VTPGAQSDLGRPGAGLAALTPIVPEWDVDPRVGALMTTRAGGVSAPPWDSLNLGRGSGDSLAAVEANRRRVADAIGAAPVYLGQVHGSRVVRIDASMVDAVTPEAADASFTTEAGVACAVMAADCMPVLLAAPAGRAVGAAHAGWRGLAAGVLERLAQALCDAAGCGPHELSVWLGPCIGPAAFEVGADVLTAFAVDAAPRDHARFVYRPRADGQPRWLADLVGLARDRLHALGVQRVGGGSWCTVQDRSRFFSFRRDGVTGRMAAAVWIRGR
jgi:polyphenol oxidase